MRSRNLFGIALLVAVIFAAGNLFAAGSPVGTWKTISDKTKKPASIVKIWEKDGKLYGKIIKLFNDPDAKCTACNGKFKDKPITGMVFMWGFKKDGDVFNGGKILDPDSGKIYNCKMEVVNGGKVLNVRGSLDRWGLAGRTQKWLKEN